jgi:hypothetical protein
MVILHECTERCWRVEVAGYAGIDLTGWSIVPYIMELVE